MNPYWQKNLLPKKVKKDKLVIDIVESLVDEGFFAIDLPLFERSHFDNSANSYGIVDFKNGGVFELRSDITSQIISIIKAKNSGSISLPSKICYSGDVFRLKMPYKHKAHNMTVCGFENIDIAPDFTECVNLSQKVYQMLSKFCTEKIMIEYSLPSVKNVLKNKDVDVINAVKTLDYGYFLKKVNGAMSEEAVVLEFFDILRSNSIDVLDAMLNFIKKIDDNSVLFKKDQFAINDISKAMTYLKDNYCKVSFAECFLNSFYISGFFTIYLQSGAEIAKGGCYSVDQIFCNGSSIYIDNLPNKD